MNKEKSSAKSEENSELSSSSNQSRREFIKKGLFLLPYAVPVIETFAVTTALAGGRKGRKGRRRRRRRASPPGRGRRP
ncbi:MAG: hypothetical protein ACE5QV_01435 [Fidelibacterota bacterium]